MKFCDSPAPVVAMRRFYGPSVQAPRLPRDGRDDAAALVELARSSR